MERGKKKRKPPHQKKKNKNPVTDLFEAYFPTIFWMIRNDFVPVFLFAFKEAWCSPCNGGRKNC